MVKISNKVLLAGGLATTIALTGCGKYEDGPNFSLLTKKQRLTGDWEMEKWIPYGQSNLINNGLNIDIEFDKDGDFDMKVISTYTNYDYYGNPSTYTDVYNHKGDWEFSSDKEEIELDFDGNIPDWDIEITRLTNKEFEGEITSDYYYGKSNLFSKVSDKSGDGPGTTRFEAEKD
jgi:hypothetical protein